MCESCPPLVDAALRPPRYSKGTSFTEKLMCHDWPEPPIWPEDLKHHRKVAVKVCESGP